MQGILRHNPERTVFEAQVDAERFQPQGWPSTQIQLLTGETSTFLSVLDGFEGLKPFTIYQLVAMPTLVQPETAFAEGEVDEDDDDDDEDFDDDDDDDDDDDYEEDFDEEDDVDGDADAPAEL